MFRTSTFSVLLVIYAGVNVSSWSINSKPNFDTTIFNKGINNWKKVQLSAVVVREETSSTSSGTTTTTRPVKKPTSRPGKTSAVDWRRNNIRIRTTRKEDLDQISNILTQNANSVKNENINDSSNYLNGKYDFNQMISNLRMKASFKEQLNHRLNAISHGKDALKIMNDIEECVLLDQYLAHIWYTNEKLRTSIELAVHSSAEECAWDNHSNFAVPPDDSSFLHHTMISIEDSKINDIIGFCEIAILPIPSASSNNNNDECTKKSYAPFIVNLVIGSSHRRRGIAKHVLNLVKRHVRLNYSPCFPNLGLYVHEDNLGAIKLYENSGFSNGYNYDEKSCLCFMYTEL